LKKLNCVLLPEIGLLRQRVHRRFAWFQVKFARHLPRFCTLEFVTYRLVSRPNLPGFFERLSLMAPNML
jgi:hypothetical protein